MEAFYLIGAHADVWIVVRHMAKGAYFFLPLGVFIIRCNGLLHFCQLSKPSWMFVKDTGCVTAMAFLLLPCRVFGTAK